MRRNRSRTLEILEDRKMLAVVADIDLDGDRDIVSSSEQYGLAWFEAQGEPGEYQRHAISGHEGRVEQFDPDNDGDQDLLTRRAWYEFSDGEFVRHAHTFQTASRALPFDSGADGDTDILLHSGNGYVVLENLNGGGQFEEQARVTPANVNCDASADVDGDGDVDCVGIRITQDQPFDPQLAWLDVSRLQADGSYQTNTILTDRGDETWSTSYQLETADVDGDGAMDAVVHSDFPQGYSRTIRWHKNLGEEGFSSPRLVYGYTTSGNGDFLDFVSDIDGDGDLDVAVASSEAYESRGFYWIENRSGSFNQSSHLIRSGYRRDFHAHDIDQAFIDMNGDDVLDRVVLTEQIKTLDGGIDHPNRAIRIDTMARAMRNGTTAVNSVFPEDGLVEFNDYEAFIEEVNQIPWGDSNVDGQFNTRDLVNVMTIGEYEDDIVGNSTWSDGDWNGDGDFTTADLTLLFAKGGYRQEVAIDNRSFGLILTGNVINPNGAADGSLSTHATLREGAFTLDFRFTNPVQLNSMRMLDRRSSEINPGPDEWLPNPIDVVAFDAAGQEILNAPMPLEIDGEYSVIDFNQLEGVASLQLNFRLPRNTFGPLNDVSFLGVFN